MYSVGDAENVQIFSYLVLICSQVSFTAAASAAGFVFHFELRQTGFHSSVICDCNKFKCNQFQSSNM